MAWLAIAACLALPALPVWAQETAPQTQPFVRPGPLSALRAPELKGRTVEGVEVRGNKQVSSAVIKNQIRTRVGEVFDPSTVAEDYQRIYGLRQFSNVEARAEPTANGVVIVFVVTEQRQINSVRFKGNRSVDDLELRQIIDIRPGESIDPFRIALARQAIVNLYKDKNFPLARVEVDQQSVAEGGDVAFNITEGPNVRIRKVDFKSAGELSFTKDRLKDQIKSTHWVLIFNAGKYDPQQVEDDVAALRRFYESKGFFDARIGRQLVWSPDLTELQINFTIDEGPRYVVKSIKFEGNTGLTEAQLRQGLKLLEGREFDAELQQRDIREMVRQYSGKFGYIYQPQSTDPDYLRIEAKPKFLAEPGEVEVVYSIREGKEFRLGNILVKGNNKSQDKLVLREFRDLVPGAKFNAGELQDSEQRTRRLPYFSNVVVTPIGEEPGVRDLLVEVQEQRTASFNVGAGVNSNGGVGGNLTYEQRNFDITNPPSSFGDFFSDRAFVGAGQTLRISFEPGTEQTNASIRFSEPYLFDQPFSFTNDLYLRTRVREQYDDSRLGDTVTFGHRFNYELTGSISLRGERVKIDNIEDPRKDRAPEILASEGKSTLTSVALTMRHDTTNPGLFPDRGHTITGRYEYYGALGGDYDFHKVNVGVDLYQSIHEDLLDRKTVLSFHANAGFIPVGDSVYFERFYAGGIGSIRGFKFRGVSPRSGREDDAVGGDFSLTGSLELNFPVAGDQLRGVVFVDAGDVEPSVRFGTIRTSVGAGVRVLLPFFGQTPLAVDFAIPVTKADGDEKQLISFSFGFIQ